MKTATLSRNPRRYHSALREEQARQTRQKIVETVIGLLRDGAADGLSVPQIAERSRISVATIYRHFPDREALFDGIDAWLSEHLQRPPFPDTIQELIAGAPALFRYYEKASDLMRLARTHPTLRELQDVRRKERDRLVPIMAARLTVGLEPRRANAICALIRTFYSFDAYEAMQTRFGVTADEASEVVEWATGTLVRELDRERAVAARSARPRKHATPRDRKAR